MPNYRNRGRQRHCAKPASRKASKAQSQRQWLAREENQNYFRSPDNSDRVKAWRREHPGYWRKKKPAGGIALQDPCSAQQSEREPVTTPCVPPALQEDIARSARSVLARGLDILGTVRGGPFSRPMKSKPILRPERLRHVPRQFSWIDQRLVGDRHITRCRSDALALYLLLTAAVLDRLLHHAETVIIEGSSYRMKDRVET